MVQQLTAGCLPATASWKWAQDRQRLACLEAVCPNGEVIGVDPFDDGLAFARRRCRCRLVRADIFALPFAEPFEVIGLFDVLEHIKDDAAALLSLYAQLAPGGALMLTVPAHQTLWSYADENAGHYRRYASHGLSHLLQEVGFRVEYHTSFMTALYPLLWAGRRLAAWRNQLATTHQGRAELFVRELQINPLLNRVLTWLHRWEASVIGRRVRLPLGTSLLVVARKPALARAAARAA